MRALCAHALGVASSRLRFNSDEAGLPYLSGAPDICLSWSRSGPVSLAVLGRNIRIGADVEREQPRNLQSIMEMTATEAEAACVLDAPEPERLQRFYRLWTAKEAILKYRGSGLRGGAKTAHVPDAYTLGAQSAEAEDGVILHALSVEPGLQACIAAPAGVQPEKISLNIQPASD